MHTLLHCFEFICISLKLSNFLLSTYSGAGYIPRTPAQNPTPFVCGRGGGASVRKGVKMGRAGY